MISDSRQQQNQGQGQDQDRNPIPDGAGNHLISRGLESEGRHLEGSEQYGEDRDGGEGEGGGGGGGGENGGGGQGQKQNVGHTERLISGFLGGAMALYGLKRRSLGGLIVAGVGGALAYRAYSGQCGVYKKLGIDTNRSGAGAKPADYFERGVKVERSVTIDRPPEELYQFWRNFENLPRFMKHLDAVEVLDDRRSRWTVDAPIGHVSWEAEIINDEPNTLIAWKSVEGADVDNTGSVRFLPVSNGRGTVVKVNLEYIPPAGQVGRLIAKAFGEEPGQQVRDDLRRFKQIIETGEVPTTEGQSRGPKDGRRENGGDAGKRQPSPYGHRHRSAGDVLDAAGGGGEGGASGNLGTA